jgi:hypothetical protein
VRFRFVIDIATLSQSWRIQPNVLQSLIETSDSPAIHILVCTVATVDPHHRRFISVGLGVGGWPAEGLSPVRGESLRVLGMESVAERVTDYFVGHHAGVPRPGDAE